MAEPYISNISLPYGVHTRSLAVVDLPIGYSLAKLRMRCDEFITVFLRSKDSFEQWHVDFVKGSTTEIYPAYPVAKNVRPTK
jgi:hypothetical protein